jgi:hypothetical protein
MVQARPPDASSCCLRFLDTTGDTIFNRLQAAVLLEELEALERKNTSAAERELLAELRSMATRCVEEPHLYLRFFGD